MAKDSLSTQLYDERNNPLSALDHHTEVIAGNVVGHSMGRKFGFNLDIDTAAAETVASFGGRVSLLSSAETISFVSTSAEDGAGTATGALTIRVFGLDGNYLEVSEDVTLNGLGAVVTTQSFVVINRIRVLTAGSTRTNVGVITGTASVAATTQAQIPVGYGVTQQCFFGVPANKSCIIEKITFDAVKIGAGTQPVVTCRVYEHAYNGSTYSGTTSIIFEETFDTAVVGSTIAEALKHTLIDPGSIIEMVVSTDTDNTSAYGHLEYMLIPEPA